MTSNTVKCGDIFYVTENPQKPAVGAEIWPDRAALIVSADVFNNTSGAVMIVYLSTANKKPCPTHISVTSGNKTATAMCEQVHTVDKSRLTDYFGRVTDEELKDVKAGILFGLGINHGKNPQGIFKKYEKQLRLEQAKTASI